MKLTKPTSILLFMLIALTQSLSAQQSINEKNWTINDLERKAIIYIPSSSKSKPTPIIFAFHGHGGTMQRMQSARNFEKLWPEAIIVYPQGLNTPGVLTDPEGKRSGWVMNNTQNNRDLIFFDEMLSYLKANFKIDLNRIYASGHSNGGGFTYLLWVSRPNEFAAFAPTATAGGKLIPFLKTPKPALHLMGENDPLVKTEWQIATYNKVLRINGCEQDGEKLDSNITRYKGKEGNDVEIYLHKGGHEYPKKANEAIINFFKKHTKKAS